jgi:hypothetical protein
VITIRQALVRLIDQLESLDATRSIADDLDTLREQLQEPPASLVELEDSLPDSPAAADSPRSGTASSPHDPTARGEGNAGGSVAAGTFSILGEGVDR